MLATFVIGLREGLEAALIVGIIAAFLRRNGRSLAPMKLGVSAAILLSLGVGVALKLLETSLPQAQQEGLESVIGAVAVVFVSSMVVWMNGHARSLKCEIEHAAADALSIGSARALTVMAFLAVLKEGFETSVFLLATFSAASNTTLAVTGAVLGILASAAIGYGLYTGGVRINLGKFFSVTSVFLVLVAAGLVVSAISTAHGAGWLDAGQQRTVDLTWLTPAGTVRSAIFTGLLGVPADPRLIEVVGWFAYVVPMSLFLFWPKKHRPSAATGVKIRYGVGAALAVVAAGLAIGIGPATMPDLGPATLVAADGSSVGTVSHQDGNVVVTEGSDRISVPLTGGRPADHAGVPDATEYSQQADTSTAGLPTTLTIEQLAALSGGRLPVGISPQTAPGPYRASWTRTGETQLWLAGDQVLDFTRTDRTTLTLSGGGLAAPRTLTVSGTLPDGTTVTSNSVGIDPAHTQAVAAAASGLRAEQVERQFWGRTFPALLGVAALIVLAFAARARRRLAPADPASQPSGRSASTPLATSRREINVS